MEDSFPTSNTSRGQVAREQLVKDFKALTRDADELVRATADEISEKARDARSRLADAVDRARSSMDEWQSHGSESARAALRKADTTIRGNPYETLGVAFGLGLLAGFLLTRRN